MALFFIDFKNTNSKGLSGIDTLERTDKVFIFWGMNTKSVKFDDYQTIMRSKAQIENIKVKKAGKNYLDFQLASLLGMKVGERFKGPYIIVSKDTGYDSVVDFFSETGIDIIRRDMILDEMIV